MPEDTRDISARLLATAALAGGTGIALYKGFKESPGALRKVGAAIGGAGTNVPRMMVETPIEDRGRFLKKAFDAAEDVMNPAGRQELLRRTYERALYGAGIVADDQRARIVGELIGVSHNWETAQGAIAKYEHQLGGFQGLYDALREISGGTVVGGRRKEAAQLIRELPDMGPDEFGRRGGYLRSAFEPGGQFWEERFGLEPSIKMPETPTVPLVRRSSVEQEQVLAKGVGQKIHIGIRQAGRPRFFLEKQQGAFQFNVLGGGKVDLPFSELQIGGAKSTWFLQVPSSVEHRGINFVAADHKGMGYASVPHFAVPLPGGKYEKVPWNRGINMMLYGDKEAGIEGLAQKLQKLHGDEKAMRDLTSNWNTKIRGLFHRVTGSQGNMTQALMHSESILPMDRLLAQVSGEEVEESIEGLTKFYGAMKKSGFDIGPLAGVDPMAKQYRVSLRDWAKRWDIFGEGYALEKRFTGRIKPFKMTAEAVGAMEQVPIAGILPRGYGITATTAARAEMEQMPQAVAYLTLGQAKHFGEEEAVIAKRLAPMMTMKSAQKFEVLAGTTQAAKSELLKEGAVVGVDYRTGKTILAKGASGMVEQRILDARQVGDIVQLQVETQLPLQDQMKIFGYKAQVYVARGDIEKELFNEWGAGKAALRFSKDLEFIGHVDLMKKIPQEVNKQMAEASWLIMQKRLSEAGVLAPGVAGGVGKQRIRTARATGTFAGRPSIPKNYVNMDMWMYVRDQQYRDKVLKNRQKGGVRIAKRLGLQGEQEALGTGLEILRYAKKHGLDKEELSLIGGAFYKQLETAARGSEGASKLLKEVGLTSGEIGALKQAGGVLAMPTMHVGGYASFDHKWRRAGMDYRALTELKAQRWGEAGELLIGEIGRRVIPAQDLMEMERAALSVVGRGVPEGVEKINRIREAQEALGQREFIFDYGGKEIYVPGTKAKGMGQFASEVGDIRSQELRSAYEKYFGAQRAIRDFPGEASNLKLEKAFQNLRQKVHKEWAAAGSLRGKVIGTSSPVARRRVPSDARATISKRFSSIEEFVGETRQVFTIGVTRETSERMFRDLLSKGSPGERAFLESQREAFLSKEKVTGFVWRHPTHRPQSLMPAWFELVEGKGESAQFHRLELKQGERVLDVSLAQGMKLDYDFDHVQLGLIADEKVKVAQDQLLNSRRWKEEFIQGTAIQYDLMERVKQAAASRVASENVPEYTRGLQRLVGVKLETGTISNLVGEMRAAANFQAPTQERNIVSYLLAELEEGPIGGKHGLYAGEVKEHLQTFMRGEGTGVRSAMRDAWDIIFKEETFKAGNIQYAREEIIDNIAEWTSASQESKDLAAFRNNARRGAQAQKGAEWNRITNDQFIKAIDDAKAGRGDLNATLTRGMRLGPGSAVSKSRAAVESARGVGNAAIRAFKKHWKYPAVGAAIALGISSVLGGSDLGMKDHSQQVNALGSGPASPHISAPVMNPNRIITSAGGAMPVGYGMHTTGDYNSYGVRQLTTLAQETNSSVRINDNRGAITPEYIQKAQRERYY